MIAPMNPMASTPTCSKLAGSSSSIPIKPAAALSQTIRAHRPRGTGAVSLRNGKFAVAEMIGPRGGATTPDRESNAR
jgi:hypothetical protein